MRNFEKYRIAVYYKNFKGIFDVSGSRFENIFSYDEEVKPDTSVISFMKEHIFRLFDSSI